MTRYILLLVAAMLLTPAVTHAHTDTGDFAEAENIIEEQTPCSDLSDEQLRHIGDYYMEQIHPGEQHEIMDRMMGGEGSENLAAMHRIMAEEFYCNGDLTGEIDDDWGEMMRGGMMGNVVSDTADDTGNTPTPTPEESKAPVGFWQQQFALSTVVGWILLLGGIAALGRYLIKK